jgi:hypothetical protein
MSEKRCAFNEHFCDESCMFYSVKYKDCKLLILLEKIADKLSDLVYLSESKYKY